MRKRAAAAALLTSLMLAACLLSGCGAAKAELALITDSGTVDDGSLNQGAWEGLVQYAEENKLTSKFYQPEQSDGEAYLASIDLAVKNGAQTVVCAGEAFEEAVNQAQQSYPDVCFLVADCELSAPSANTAGLVYAEEQAGFLAGYAAVREGCRSLGYVGCAERDDVARYGLGFIQGAEYAAQELALGEQSVQLRYEAFSDTPAETVEAWHADGVECVFAAGGDAAVAALESAGTVGVSAIGADVDRSTSSDAVLTSAVKGVSASVYSTLAQIYAGTFEGGQNIRFDAKSGGVALAMESARFKTFAQADYDAILTRLQTDADGIATSLAGSTGAGVSSLNTTAVAVIE